MRNLLFSLKFFHIFDSIECKELISLEKNEQPIVIEINMNKLAKSYLFWTVILSIVFIVLNMVIHRQTELTFSLWGIILFFVGYFSLIVLHEAFHLLGFMLFGKAKFRELEYGLNLKLGVAYATTKKPLSNKAMKKSLLLPFWTTGVLPSVIGFIIGSNLLVFLGANLIAGAMGDFYMYKELVKYPNNALVKDDPNLPILYVYPQNESFH